MSILVTGSAGFIGSHVVKYLCEHRKDSFIVGLDNLNDYYDPDLKRDRICWTEHPRYRFYEMALEDREAIQDLFQTHRPEIVIHLAAQPGVRYSLQNPYAYIDSNIVGFINILEACRHYGVRHLIYASSSSVYGANRKMPFSEKDRVDHPVSLYAATKKSNELMAHTYSHLFGIPTTGLRFFTVYGPWGRPDMAYFSFARDIVAGRTIKVFNHGRMKRDFTYIDDIVEGIVRLMDRPPTATNDTSAPYKIYNIGNNKPVALMDFIATLERHLGVEAKKEYLPMQPGDVHETYADISELQQDVGFRPSTSLEEGLGKFVRWFKDYYGKDRSL